MDKHKINYNSATKSLSKPQHKIDFRIMIFFSLTGVMNCLQPMGTALSGRDARYLEGVSLIIRFLRKHHFNAFLGK